MSTIHYPRLKYELQEVLASYQIPLTLTLLDDYPDDNWAHFGVIFNYRGYRVRGRYDEDHPARPPIFQISPAPSCHYPNGHLCFCKAEEWCVNYTLALAIAEVMRFLDDYDNGQVS